MMNIICEWWDCCINANREKCYKCTYNRYLNEVKEDYNDNFEIEQFDIHEEMDFNKYL